MLGLHLRRRLDRILRWTACFCFRAESSSQLQPDSRTPERYSAKQEAIPHNHTSHAHQRCRFEVLCVLCVNGQSLGSSSLVVYLHKDNPLLKMTAIRQYYKHKQANITVKCSHTNISNMSNQTIG